MDPSQGAAALRRSEFGPLTVRGRVVNGVFTLLSALTWPWRRGSSIEMVPRKILVLQLQQVGDTVIFTPTLRALRAHFPASSIDLLVSPLSAQLYAHSPYVSTLHVTPAWRVGPGSPRIRELWPLLRQLRRERYDLAICGISEQSFRYTLIAWLSGARSRIGFNVAGRGFLHSHVVPYRAHQPWVQTNLDLARALGATPDGAREEIFVGESDRVYASSMLEELNVDRSGAVVLMHPGSNWQSKTWFPDRWAALADAIRERTGATIIFVGTEGERPYVDAVVREMRGASHSVLGRTTLAQLAALIAEARLFVGTDSGPRHIAAAVGVPQVTVMSAQNDTAEWLGDRPREIVLRTEPWCKGCRASACGHMTCMRLIEVEPALQACLSLMGERNATALDVV